MGVQIASRVTRHWFRLAFESTPFLVSCLMLVSGITFPVDILAGALNRKPSLQQLVADAQHPAATAATATSITTPV